MSIQAIKEAILALAEADRLELEHWLTDRKEPESKRDSSPDGRGDAAMKQADAEIDSEQDRRD